MDHEFHKYNPKSKDVQLKSKPSEIFHGHVFCTYEDDEIGLAFLDIIGEGNVMWASDYPHGDTTWPNSKEVIRKSPIAKLEPEVQRKILHDTAARLYRIQ